MLIKLTYEIEVSDAHEAARCAAETTGRDIKDFSDPVDAVRTCLEYGVNLEGRGMEIINIVSES